MNEMKSEDIKKEEKVLLVLSIPLLILLIIASFSGIFISATYTDNTASFAAQGIGQDMVNLFIVAPLFCLSAIFSYKSNKKAKLIWAGLLSYILYSYVIYCFAQPFNFLFLVYCAILSLSFYSFFYFLHVNTKDSGKSWYNSDVPVKTVSIFFFIICLMFYFLWLSEIIPSIINNETPASVIENGLNSNPVHVLDIAILLPALTITSVFLLKEKGTGYLLAPILLIFLVMMAFAIIGMVIAMILLEIETDLGLAIIFLVISILGLLITAKYLRSV